jgi:predicted dehydrogenase
MNAVAEKSDALFGMMFNQRTNCVYRKMREMIAAGEIGELQRVTWIITDWYRTQFYYDSGNWRATWDGEGGGVLFNQCPHQLDLVQWVVGKLPKYVNGFCQYGKWHDIEVEDDATVYVEYPNGATGTFITTTGDAPGTNRFEIVLDGGTLICDGNSLILKKLDVPEPEFSKTNTVAFASPKVDTITVDCTGYGDNTQHSGILNAMANAILHGGKLLADGREGIKGLTLSNAMHLSAWLGKPIELPMDDALFKAELDKRIATSRRKENVNNVVSDTSSSYNF